MRAAIDDYAEKEAARLLDATNGLIERVALQVAKHFEPPCPGAGGNTCCRPAGHKPPHASGKPSPVPRRKSLTNAVWLIADMTDEEAAIAVALIRAVKAPKNDTGVN